MKPDRRSVKGSYLRRRDDDATVDSGQAFQILVGALCAILTFACLLWSSIEQNRVGQLESASRAVARTGQTIKAVESDTIDKIESDINGGQLSYALANRSVKAVDHEMAQGLERNWQDIRRDSLLNQLDAQKLTTFSRELETAQLKLLDEAQAAKEDSFIWLICAAACFVASFALVITMLRRKPTQVLVERVVQAQPSVVPRSAAPQDDWLIDVSRRHFEGTFEKLPVPCASFTTDGKITAWNAAMEEATGLNASDVFQKSFWDMVQWSKLGELGQTALYKLLQGEPIEMVDWLYEHPAGENLDFRCKLIPVLGSTGTVISAVAAINDVTLQRRQESLLIENDVTKTAMLSAIPDTLLRIDTDGRLVDLRDNAGFVVGSPLSLLGETSWQAELGESIAMKIKDAAKRSRLVRGYIRFEHHSDPSEPERHIEIRVAPCGQSDVLAILHDITDRYRAQTAIEDAAARLRHLVEGSADLLVLVDQSGVITYQSPASRHVLGADEGANIGRHLVDIVENNDRKTVEAALTELSQSPAAKSRFYVQAIHSQLGARDMEIYGRNLLDNPYVSALVFNIRDVTDRRNLERELSSRLGEIEKANHDLARANKVLSQMATTDGLTGLRNHRTSQEYLAAAVAHCDRTHTPVSLAVIDVDFFKKINDSYGHQEGDSVLQWLGVLAQQSCRHLHMAGRYGGEEFVLIMPETDYEMACQEIEEFRKAVEANSERSYKVTVSAGVVTSLGGVTANHLFSEADKCLYASKQGGRNRVTSSRLSGEIAA